MTTLEALLIRNKEGLTRFAEKLGYVFQDMSLLQKAFIHSSYAFEQGQDLQNDNETLEFLGDAVLDLTVGYALIKRFPALREGELTRLRAALVQESHLAVMAKDIGLGELLLLGKGEDASRGREKSSILSCAFEAVMGAVFLDGGYEAARQVVDALVVPYSDEKKEAMYLADSKSRLQEMIQERHNEGPVYVLEKAEGPDHAKIFHVSVRFQDKVLARGTARSKKEAEQQAAAEAISSFADFDL
ncbi:MAG: ribonuclease III [Deltaproteobacteria bacterium]|nr:ribonuclease III [Deltaproteobacteria bacterium]